MSSIASVSFLTITALSSSAPVGVWFKASFPCHCPHATIIHIHILISIFYHLNSLIIRLIYECATSSSSIVYWPYQNLYDLVGFFFFVKILFRRI
uniref:Uncharacterized protein n=1 Tax=Anopheles darlingi TaxID=43151 RepID=A0A2M4DE42_ANODA